MTHPSIVQVPLRRSTAEAAAEAIEVVLSNCDVHSDEAHLLEYLRENIYWSLEND